MFQSDESLFLSNSLKISARAREREGRGKSGLDQGWSLGFLEALTLRLVLFIFSFLLNACG